MSRWMGQWIWKTYIDFSNLYSFQIILPQPLTPKTNWYTFGFVWHWVNSWFGLRHDCMGFFCANLHSFIHNKLNSRKCSWLSMGICIFSELQVFLFSAHSFNESCFCVTSAWNCDWKFFYENQISLRCIYAWIWIRCERERRVCTVELMYATDSENHNLFCSNEFLFNNPLWSIHFPLQCHAAYPWLPCHVF